MSQGPMSEPATCEVGGGVRGLDGPAERAPDGVVDLYAATDVALVGGKAAPLARAAAAGFRVPPGLVVTTRAGDSPAALAAALAELLAALGPGPFAVRSSAVGEDASVRSFAGQLETMLSVEAARVPEVALRCRASGRALRALRYAGRGSAGPVAVLVQQMVRASVSGVAFSADPHTGERGVVLVEAVRGLGDRLVGGEVSGEAWRVAGGAAVCTRSSDEPVLEPGLALRVAELARGLERLFGAPRDVEWAYADGELYVLQARPITALPEAPRPIDVAPPEGTWERDDHHAVLSPLGWDWLAPYFEAMARAMGEVMPVKEVRTANIGGQLYTQMVMEGGGGAPPPRLLLWLASRLVPAMRRANRKCIDLLEREDYLTTLAEWTQRGRAELARATDELFDPEPGRLTDDELLARSDEVLAHTARGLSLHAELHGPSLMGLGKLALFLEDELGWEMDRALALVTGASSSTTELHRSLEALVAAHHEELGDGPFPATWGELVRRAPGLGGALAAWLSKNHLRMLHYDPKHATLGERPEVVLSIVESVVASRRQSTREPQAAADDVLARARAALRPELHRELDRLLENARRSYALRDENGVETVSRPAGLLRHYVLELGRRLPLEAPEHAVYLQVREHRPALARELSDLRELVARRRGEESWAERNRGPRRYGPPPGPMPDPTAFPRGLCRMMRVFSWMMAAEALPEATPGAGPLRGVGIGHRVVTGRARVLERAEELATLRHGEILVCRITSPEWSVALGRVSAIVTDEGALLSHPAIIAREYGVTAVVGTSLATRAIATGDTVRVDPLEATVTVVRPAGARAPA